MITPANIANPATGWYVWFVQHIAIPGAGTFTYMVTFGEILVGLGLIFGVLTGIAAFFGLFMNLNFMLAGAISINPIIGGLALFLILAWRVAGYYGFDRYLLPLLGTPWTGRLARQPKPQTTVTPPGACRKLTQNCERRKRAGREERYSSRPALFLDYAPPAILKIR